MKQRLACSTAGCGNQAAVRGVCDACYARAKRGTDPRVVLAPPKDPARTIPDEMLAAGITYRQLDYWVREGLLTPDTPAGSGSGTRRIWSSEEIEVGVRMAHLVKVGLQPVAAAKAARQGAECWLSDRVKVSVIP